MGVASPQLPRQHVGGAYEMVTQQKVDVCIPTVGESLYLPRLLESLTEDPSVGRIILYVNEPGSLQAVRDQIPAPLRSRVEVEEVPERDFYQTWNTAMDRAADAGNLLAILNDDIAFPLYGSITLALTVWRDFPEVAILGFDSTESVPYQQRLLYCSGSYRHGGIPGFAFLVDPQRAGRVDESFEIWYGDDDLFFSTEAAGHRLAKCWVRVQHAESLTLNQREWVVGAIERDKMAWRTKYGAR